MLYEELYLGDYESAEALEKDLEWYWSGSRFDAYMHCARRGQVLYDQRLMPKDEDTINLDVGSALHSGLNTWYAYGGKKGGLGAQEASLKAMLTELEDRGGLPILPPDDKNAHLTPGHLQIVLKNYFDWAKLHDSVEPIITSINELNLDNVMGAKFKHTEDGLVVLGESAIIMRMKVSAPWGADLTYPYAAVPDLPVRMGKSVYVMDHKTTGWPLSSYWAAKWRADNTLRVYCIVIRDLLKKQKVRMRGIMINGVWVGKGASNYKSKGKKFERYGPWDYDEGSLEEALINHAAAIETRRFHQEKLGYAPQSTGLYCPNCPARHLCQQDPTMRKGVETVSYKLRKRRYLLEVKNA
jgi:hypothetical protein